MLYAFVDDFHFLLFDFPHLSSFNACEELDHLIILYPLSPALMSIGRDIVPPPNYYGGAALGASRGHLCDSTAFLFTRELHRTMLFSLAFISHANSSSVGF